MTGCKEEPVSRRGAEAVQEASIERDELKAGAAEKEKAPSHARHATMAAADTVTAAAEQRSSMHRQAFSTTTVPSPLAPSPQDGASAAATADEGDGDAGVLSQYLRSVLTLFFERFLASVLPSLPRLTDIGAAQLAADLDYLSNISSVIHAESEAILAFWKKAAELSADTGRALVAEHVVGVGRDTRPAAAERPELQGWREDQLEALVRSDAFRTVARLRGWM